MVNTIISALVAALMGFVTSCTLLLTTAGVDSFDDVSTVSWTVAGLGALGAFLKDYYAILSRALASNVTKQPLAQSKYYPPQEGPAHEPETVVDAAERVTEMAKDENVPRT